MVDRLPSYPAVTDTIGNKKNNLLRRKVSGDSFYVP